MPFLIEFVNAIFVLSFLFCISLHVDYKKTYGQKKAIEL